MQDHTLMITVPAKLLYELSAVAGGYTMSRGQFLDQRVLTRRAYDILWDAGYEYWQDERLF